MTVKAQLDTDLRCQTCGRQSKTNFASSLRGGWPQCCGHTMALVCTSADVGEATRQAMGVVPGLLGRLGTAAGEGEGSQVAAGARPGDGSLDLALLDGSGGEGL